MGYCDYAVYCTAAGMLLGAGKSGRVVCNYVLVTQDTTCACINYCAFI